MAYLLPRVLAQRAGSHTSRLAVGQDREPAGESFEIAVVSHALMAYRSLDETPSSARVAMAQTPPPPGGFQSEWLPLADGPSGRKPDAHHALSPSEQVAMRQQVLELLIADSSQLE
jgi:hypothetical protein